MRYIWPAIMIVFPIIFFTDLSQAQAGDELCHRDRASLKTCELACCCTDQMMVRMQKELSENGMVKECCDNSMACTGEQSTDEEVVLSVVQIDFSQLYLNGSFSLSQQEPKRGQGRCLLSPPRAPPVPVYITHCSFLI